MKRATAVTAGAMVTVLAALMLGGWFVWRWVAAQLGRGLLHWSDGSSLWWETNTLPTLRGLGVCCALSLTVGAGAGLLRHARHLGGWARDQVGAFRTWAENRDEDADASRD